MDYGIRLTFRAPLSDAAHIPAERGWKPVESDHETTAFTNSFASEQEFQAELAGLKAALGSRIKSIEYLDSATQDERSGDRA